MIRKTREAGFTLIELVVVIVILGILAAVAIPRFTDLAADARAAVVDGACGAAQSAAVLLYASNKAASGSTDIRNFMTVGGDITVAIAACNVTVTPSGGAATACGSNPIPAVLCNPAL